MRFVENMCPENEFGGEHVPKTSFGENMCPKNEFGGECVSQNVFWESLCPENVFLGESVSITCVFRSSLALGVSLLWDFPYFWSSLHPLKDLSFLERLVIP